MKITGSQVNPVSQVHLDKVAKARAATEVEKMPQADRVELSTDAAAIDAARKVIAEMPDIRADKVEALRQQIQDGTYTVSPETIADQMLAEVRLSKLAEK